MTREEFARLVQRIEARHADRPARLRRAVVALALLSYVSLFAWLGVAFAVAVPFFLAGFYGDRSSAPIFFLVGGAIAAVGVVTTLAVLRVPLEPPEGLEIRRADAPALFDAIDVLHRRLRSAPVHRVWLSWSCNAGVCAVPRLGLLGWPRHHLELGLPLMEVLSPEEFQAVLAHEFAHISAQHGRMGNWIYRLRRSWQQAFAQMERRQAVRRVSLHGALLKFFDWFWPRFSAHAFVLSRQNEFEADATAARMFGQEAAASALLRIRLYDRLLSERFWPELWRGVAAEAEPPGDVFDRLRAAVQAGAPADQSGQWLREAFQVFTSHDDTHPCLTERWRALDYRGSAGGAGGEPFPAPAATSAASALFGGNLDRIRQELAARWRKTCGENWQMRRAQSRLHQGQVESLARADFERDVDALWDRACATAQLEGGRRSEKLLRELLALRPGHALANFELGRQLLEAGDAAGEPFLERAMAEDDSLVPPAGGVLSAHFTRNGQTERVREVRARLDRHDARVRASHAERNTVTARDTFLPHGLTAGELAGACDVLRKEGQIESAFLARKELRHFPEQRLFVLVVRLARRWYAPSSAGKASAVVGRLVGRVHLPGRLLVIGEHGGFAGVARRVKAVPDARFYRVGEGMETVPAPSDAAKGGGR